jgi:GDP-4-dehydro-6-deoxy-D-mannose reductase
MKCFVTGAAGFAGSHLVEYLVDQGREVVAFVHQGESLLHLEAVRRHIRIESGDVRDADRLRDVLREVRPARIFHLAALSWGENSDWRSCYEVNFGGTLNLLAAWRDLNVDSRLLLVSSSHVYGTRGAHDLPLREDAPFAPDSPYAGSKAAAEMLALQFFHASGCPIVRVRPFNHTGPRQSPAFVCSSLARQVAEIELGLRPPEVLTGNLSARRDFTDVRDIVRGYDLLLEKGTPGEVYQLCSGSAVSVAEILERLVALSPAAIQIRTDSDRLRPAESPALWGGASKARDAVGWVPQYSLETTLRDLKHYWEGELRAGADRP